MQQVQDYIQQHKDRFLEELFELIRIPTISSLPEHNEDMVTGAEKVKECLLSAGAEKAEVYKTKGHPIVYGEKIIDSAKPTVLIYGHYDVQPVDPIDLWKSPPFEPEIRDGKIYARGADDDKGQMFMQVKAFEALVKTGNLNCNVKFMIEGEEEAGSGSLPAFCAEYNDMLTADVILISDTGMIAQDIPSITTGLRGLAYMQVNVTGPNRDLHSGIFGGAVGNPANILAQMIAQLTDENNHVTIPGFYDDVIEVSPEERAEMGKAPFSLDAYKEALDIEDVHGEASYTSPERTGIRPSLDVNGIWSGFTGDGAKTVLPSKAHAKISMRLVPAQDPEKIAKLFERHIKTIAPKSVKVEVEYLHGGEGYVSPIDIPGYRAAERAYEITFGKKPIPVRSGGSIPIVSMFEKVLGIKSILMGFGLESDAIHSPNENYPLFNFYKGIETIPYFYQYFPDELGK